MQPLRDKPGALFDLGSTLIEYENVPWDQIYDLCLRRGWEYLGRNGHRQPEWIPLQAHFRNLLAEEDARRRRELKEMDILDFFRRLLAPFGLEGDGELLRRFLEAYYQPIRENLTSVPGAARVLEHFRTRGHKLALVSNTVFPAAYHREDLRLFGLENYFDCTLFSSETPHCKPHPSIFAEALRVLDISPGEAFYVGDRLDVDIVGAKGAGLTAVLLRRAGRACDSSTQADLEIDRLTDILDHY